MATTHAATDAPTPVHEHEGSRPTTLDTDSTQTVITDFMSHVPSTQTSSQQAQSVVKDKQRSSEPQQSVSDDRSAHTHHFEDDGNKLLPDSYFHENLFQADNTGTRKFKSLLRGLKTIMNKEYDTSDNPDLMPGQLARFYRDLGGDYNQLYLSTPMESISFIYKSLGCSYSLQPKPEASKVEEPEIPALKTEGWIMWSTIQLLLGPDEHAGFLMNAIKRWDVIDPDTGKIFPKTLPRESLPAKPDERMAAWYEGVSERLRKEADEEAELRERQRAVEQHAEHRRSIFGRDDDENSVDSRGAAIAYFLNPLYRHDDGRPSIVRKRSRPPLSPRQSIVEKGKGAASAVGSVIRNVASPHLWDGNSSSSGNRDRRRRSVPDNRYHHPSEPATAGAYDERLPVPQSGSPGSRRSQRRSDRPSSSSAGSRESNERAPQAQHLRPQQLQREHSLKHSRSHEPTPSQREYDGDYFQQGDVPYRDRKGSAQTDIQPGFGPSFAPSPGLPMAARIAQQQPTDQRSHSTRLSREDRSFPPTNVRDRDDEYNAPPRKRSRSRYDDRPPHDDRRYEAPIDERRYDERPEHRRHDERLDERPRHEHRRHDDRTDDRSRHEHRRSHDRPPYDDRSSENRRPPHDRARFNGHRPSSQRPGPRDDYGDPRREYDSPDRGSAADARRRSASARRSGGSDLDSGYDGADDQRRNRKQTRFAPAPIAGVDGRRYVDESPWQDRG